jgi:hypothetical protein
MRPLGLETRERGDGVREDREGREDREDREDMGRGRTRDSFFFQLSGTLDLQASLPDIFRTYVEPVASEGTGKEREKENRDSQLMKSFYLGPVENVSLPLRSLVPYPSLPLVLECPSLFFISPLSLLPLPCSSSLIFLFHPSSYPYQVGAKGWLLKGRILCDLSSYDLENTTQRQIEVREEGEGGKREGKGRGGVREKEEG